MDKKEVAQKVLDYGKTLGISKEDLQKGIRYAWHTMVAADKPKKEKKVVEKKAPAKKQ